MGSHRQDSAYMLYKTIYGKSIQHIHLREIIARKITQVQFSIN